ncbi:MAG: class I tRNA ligase family protein, partial [Spirochaetales bacterium]|nr:class I tRNA ligase family protein [Spirochaetales bacterium]
SSALWPLSTLGWPEPATAEIDEGQSFLGPKNGFPDCLDYYYPGSCLVTGRDIITLWVARMVLIGLYCRGDVPFSDVFIHANILDGKGERMSKSKGNGIDPVDIIAAYGADAMRYVLADMQTGTQDIRLPVTAICPVCGFHNNLTETLHGSNIFCFVCGKNPDGSLKKGACGSEFDVLGTLPDLPAAKLTSERFDIGRAFCTKLWNSARFAFMNLEGTGSGGWTYEDLELSDRWILSGLSDTIRKVNTGLEEYNPNRALNAIRDFFWGCFCDWYLELIKQRVDSAGKETSGKIAKQVLAFCLDQVLRLLHPFIPYITEHIWQMFKSLVPVRGLGKLAAAPESGNLIQASWPKPLPEMENEEIKSTFAFLQDVTRAVREVRAARNIPPKEEVVVTIKAQESQMNILGQHSGIVKELARVKEINLDPAAKRMAGAASNIVNECMIFIHNAIDDSAEKKRLSAALEAVEKDIRGCENKLKNANFVNKAPADVVNKQKEKLEELKTNRQAITVNLKELETE